MNERLRELYIQALEYADSKIPSEFRHKDSYFAIVGEKFAELIVRDGVNAIANETANYQGEFMMAYYQGVQDAAKVIKKHFGVE